MNQIRAEYEAALQKLFRATKRYRGQIEQFRDADIGAQIWEDVNDGSTLPNDLARAEYRNNVLLEELWKLGSIRREQLEGQDGKLYNELTVDGWKLAFDVIKVTGVADTRVKHILVAYRPHSAMDGTTVRTKAEVAITATVSDDPEGVVYAGDLKQHLEDEGLYGVALQDVRDDSFDWLLARVIAMGRLGIQFRREAGLSARPPKVKTTKKVN